MARDVNVGPAAEKKLERYGVWVKVEPRNVTRDEGGTAALADLETQDEPTERAPALTDEEEVLLDELETGVGHEVAEGTRDELASLDEQLAGAPAVDELPELELEDAVEVPLADDTPAGRFDDLETLPGDDGGREPQVLSRIEAELRSIRSDLAALKQELADLRRPAPAAARTAAPAAAAPRFFEEEEDDTIALTGDELDNILNTADITEEAAGAATADVDLGEATDLAEVGADDGSAVTLDDVDLLPYEEPAAPVPAAPAKAAPASARAAAPASARAAAPAKAAPAANEAVALEEPIEELEEITDIDLDLPGEAPAELVLEDAGTTPAADELPALDLEAMPEIEEVGEADLEELPAEAEPVADADLVADLEEVPAADGEATDSFADVDLKALGDTTDSGHEAILSTDDLAASDLAELEAAAEEVVPAADEGIEIDFEPVTTPAGDGTPTDVEEVESLEAVEDLEELTAEEAAPAEAPAPAAPRAPVSAAAPASASAAAPASASAAAPAPDRKPTPAAPSLAIDEKLKSDLKTVLKTIDDLLEALPEKKIREFAKSEHFAVYQKLFHDLGLDATE